MQIFNIQKQNKYLYISFNGKIPGKRFIATTASITPVIAASYLLEQNNGLYNQSVEDDKRIEEYLLNAIKTQERISKQKIADDLGIDIKRCEGKLRRNTELYNFWLQTNHAGIKKQEEHDEAFTENKKRLEQINSELCSIVTEAYEQKIPITYSQVARQIGITPQNCISRIKNNKKLYDMWNQIEHPRITEESENINQQIADIIAEANSRGRVVSYKIIAEKAGLTKDAVEQRIHKYPQLKSLIAQGRYSAVSEESQDINEKIAEVLEVSIANNIRLRIADIAEKIKEPFLTVRNKIKKVPVLVELWAKAPHRAMNRSKTAKTIDIDEKLKQKMEAVIQDNTPITLKEIATEIGVPYKVCITRVEYNMELKSLWQQVPRKNIGGLRDYVQGENKNLIRVMESYITQGISVDGKQLAKETGMSLDKFRAKLKNYPEVKAVWQRLKDLDRAKSDNINKKIEQVLISAIENKTSLSARELERKVGTTRTACFQRIYKEDNLNQLWIQIKANENQAVKNKQNLIKTLLEQAVAENKKIRIYDISEQTNIPYALCFYHLNKDNTLNKLWQQIDHSKVREETKELSQEIINVLTDANERGQKLTINDLAEYLQAPFTKIRYALNSDVKILELWNENKKINVNLLKQIHFLKQEKIFDDKIQAQLDLDDDIFENLIAQYKDLSKVLDIHQDKDISDEEYLSWALLSKREYEQVTNLIFEKMGYKAITTRYNSDGGVDIIAEKDGKTTIIECIHNLTQKERAKEVLALEGVRAVNNIDKAVLVTASGVHFNAEDCVENINKNNSDSFKVLNIEDMIKLAKKNNIDVNSINFNDFEDNNETMISHDAYTSWYYKKSGKISKDERENWQNMPQKEYEERIVNYFINKGFQVDSLVRTVGLCGFYLLKKDEQKIIINCGSKSVIPEIDDIRSLYGCKNAYNADRVILIGTTGISSAEKSFIDLINKQKDKNGTFGIISFDKMIELLEQ